MTSNCVYCCWTNMNKKCDWFQYDFVRLPSLANYCKRKDWIGKNHAYRIESHFIFPTKISNTFDFWSKEMSCLFLFLVTILTCSSHCTISLLAFCKGHKWCAKKFMTVTFSCFSFWPNFMGKASTAAKVFHIEIALTMKYLQYFFLNWTLMFLAK